MSIEICILRGQGNQPSFTPFFDGSAEISYGKCAVGELQTFGAIATPQTFVFESDHLDCSQQAIFVKISPKKAIRISFPMQEIVVKCDRLVRTAIIL